MAENLKIMSTLKIVGTCVFVFGLILGLIERLKSPSFLILTPEPWYLKWVSWLGWIITAIAGVILIFA